MRILSEIDSMVKSSQAENRPGRVSRHVANAVDWYVNKLNKLGLIPVNMATILRDVSAKQIGGSGFRPRPLTADNFTNAQLDAIHTMAFDKNTGKYHQVSYDEYGDKFDYGSPVAEMGRYMSPVGQVATTLGRIAPSESNGKTVFKDTYDFNTDDVNVLWDDEVGALRTPEGLFKNEKEYFEHLHKLEGEDLPYSSIRRKVGLLGHRDGDPDSDKIHTSISVDDIKSRLGDGLGKHDITKPMSKAEFVLRSMGSGAAMGAPVGAALGALSGAILMLDKKRRKKWAKTMATRILAGAAIASALGAAGGGLVSNRMYEQFDKQGSASKGGKSRKERIKSAIISALSYAVPAVAVAGAGAYLGRRAADLSSEIRSDGGLSRTLNLNYL